MRSNPKVPLFFLILLFLVPIFAFKNRKKNINIFKPYITNQSSFDSNTKELKVDKYTSLLYHFNESFGSYVFDSTPYEHHGFLSSKNLWYRYSPLGSALSFTVDNHLDIQDLPFDSFSPSKFNISKALTVEMIILIKRYQFNPEPIIINKYSDLDKGLLTYSFRFRNHAKDPIEKEGDLYWILSFENGKVLSLNLTIPWESISEKWHYLVGTYNGIESRIYLDGKLMNSKKYISKLSYSPLPIFLGKDQKGTNGFCNFLIDELRISNIARSQRAIERYWKAIHTKIQAYNV